MALCGQALQAEPTRAGLVIQNDAFREGIVGIIAGQLKEEYQRPSIVFGPANHGIYKGSCRSIEELNLKEVLDRIHAKPPELIDGYGGHKMAAGVSVPVEQYPAFKERFLAILDELLAGHEFLERVEIDAVVCAQDLSVEMVQSLQVLEPCGTGFPPPVFGLISECNSIRFMGAEQQHMKYVDHVNRVDVIRRGAGEAVRAAGSRVIRKFVGTPQVNEYNGYQSVQFIAR